MGDHFPQSTPKMKVVCILALLVACVSAGPRPDKREAEIAEFGVVDTVVDSIKNKILDVVKGQLTEENIERLVDYIKEKVDGGAWADAVIDFLGDIVTQDVLDSVIDFIEEKLMGDQGTAVYDLSDSAADALVKGLGNILDILPNDVLDKIYEKVCPGCP